MKRGRMFNGGMTIISNLQRKDVNEMDFKNNTCKN
jgi:hypothetical protein